MERFGDYVIEGEIARGGTAAVFRSRDPFTKMPLAIKVLTLGSSIHDVTRKRFEREVAALGQLRHPHIVIVHATGVERGLRYLVMDFVGTSLAEQLRKRGAMAPAQAADLTRKVALALQHAHEQGLLHRDVKPDNILITSKGEPQLTDFGLVKDLDGTRSHLSQTGMFLGTPGFWPPEQARGRLDDLGPQADVYSLGATLYAILTLEPPIQAASLTEMLEATSHRLPVRPSKYCPGLDASLEAICLKCLEKDPADRYSSAAALAEDLARYLRGERVQARASLRLPRAAVAIGAPVLVLAALIVGVIVGAPSEPVEPVETVASEQPISKPAEPIAPSEPAGLVLEPIARLENPDPGALARFFNGLGLVHAEQPRAAIEAFSDAAAMDPDFARALYNRAHVYVKLNERAMALRDYSRSIKIQPDPNSLTNRGNLRLEDGDARGAIEDYVRALELDPEFATAYSNRGYLYMLQGLYDDAKRDLDRALLLDPELINAYANRGMLHVQQGEKEAALADFSKAIELVPDEWSGYMNRGLVHAQFGDHRAALGDYRKARELIPEDHPKLASLEGAREASRVYLRR